MAGEIALQHSETGRTLYAQVRNPAGLVWNGTAFVTYNAANLATYQILMPEQGAGSRYYVGNFPAAVTAAGDYSTSVFDRVGASPATTDELVGTGVIVIPVPAGGENYNTVRYVRKDGNDANSGLSTTAAKLTVAGAAATANSGDLILVGPGIYDTVATTTIPAGVSVRGSGAAATTIRCTTAGTATALSFAGSGSVTDLTVVGTGAGSVVPVGFASTSASALVERVRIVGNTDGLYVYCDRATVRESVIECSHDGMTCVAGRIVVEQSVIRSTGVAQQARALYVINGDGDPLNVTVRDSLIDQIDGGGSPKSVGAVYVAVPEDEIPVVTLAGCTIRADGTIPHIATDPGALVRLVGCAYDQTRVSAGAGAVVEEVWPPVHLAAVERNTVVLAPNGLNSVIPAEPAAKPVWGATHLNGWLSWLGALGLNPMSQSPTQQTLRNFANNATVATRSVSEDGGTFTLSVGPWS